MSNILMRQIHVIKSNLYICVDYHPSCLCGWAEFVRLMSMCACLFIAVVFCQGRFGQKYLGAIPLTKWKRRRRENRGAEGAK